MDSRPAGPEMQIAEARYEIRELGSDQVLALIHHRSNVAPEVRYQRRLGRRAYVIDLGDTDSTLGRAVTTTLELIHGGHSVITAYCGGGLRVVGFVCEDCGDDVTDLVQAIPEPSWEHDG